MKKNLFLLFSVYSLLATKIETPLTSTDLKRTIQEHKFEYVEFMFTDLLGNIKTVLIPQDEVSSAVFRGLYFDGSSIPGFTHINDSDLLLKADIKSFCAVPWTKGFQKTGQLICNVHDDNNKAYKTDARHMLKQIMHEARELGYDFMVGPELEFFLCKKDKNPADNCTYFGTDTDLAMYANKKTIFSTLKAQGIPIAKWHHEVASGQNEMSIVYTDALSMADHLIKARHTIKILAQQMDMIATFMPKPMSNQNGSGMHIHFSLKDIKTGENLFYDEQDLYNLSPLAKHFIAGVLKHIPELCSFFAPTINSYKRLVPGYEAPVYVCWGKKNRSACVRIPQFDPTHAAAARAELRCPDGMCNPYLAFASILAAGLEGIKNQYEIDAPIEKSIFEMTKEEIKKCNTTTLPTTLPDALELLQKSRLAPMYLGQQLVNKFLEIKTEEIKCFNRFITDWEKEQYF